MYTLYKNLIYNSLLIVLLLFSCQEINGQSIINGYAKVTSISGTTINVNNVDEGGDTFEVGQKVFIIQIQDDVIGGNTSDNANFGDLANIQSAGLYEIATIASVTESGSIPTAIVLTGALTTTFNTGSNSSVQIITFPTLGSPDYTTTSDITALAWDGDVGGVVAFEVLGELTLAHNIDVSDLGFEGGSKNGDYSSAGCSGGDDFIENEGNHFANKGEGIYKPNLISNSNFAAGIGKILTGGGGGGSHNAGGGGGGNYSEGGAGGAGWPNCSPSNGGYGGIALNTYLDQGRLFMGGGGGSGEGNNGVATGGSNGGGIIYIEANEVSTTGSCGGRTIMANGTDAQATTGGGNDGAGGAGAGGTVYLDVSSWFVQSACDLTITASGGNGGDVNHVAAHGGGGGGGQGAILFKNATPGVNVGVDTESGSGGYNSDTNDPNDQAEDGDGEPSEGVTPLVLPGGIIPSLWVRADAGPSSQTNGASLSYWSDQSGESHHMDQVSSDPKYDATDLINFNPVVDFDGDDSFTDDDGEAYFNGLTGISVYAVLKSDNTNQERAFFDTEASDGSDDKFSIRYDQTGASGGCTDCIKVGIETTTGFSTYESESNLQTTSPNILGTQWSPNNPVSFRMDGRATTNTSNGTNRTGTLTGGDRILIGNGTKNFWDGKIAELMLYPSSLAGTDRGQVESYLAIKYGITLDQTSATNYLSSNGEIVWTAPNPLGSQPYNKNIFGLGRDDVTGLHQCISKSENPGGKLILSMTDDFLSINRGRNNIDTDTNFVMIANNGVSEAWQDTEICACKDHFRMGKEWLIQSKGSAIDSIYIAVHKDSVDNLPQDADLFLLLDDDGDFETMEYEGTKMTLVGDYYSAQVAITNKKYLTLAYVLHTNKMRNNRRWLFGRQVFFNK